MATQGTPKDLERAQRREAAPRAKKLFLMQRMMDDMERLFENTFGQSMMPEFSETLGAQNFGAWNPDVEVFERGDDLIVRADIPGLEKKDLKLELVEGGLVIEGERRNESETRERGYYRSECSYGSFRRFVPLPEGIHSDTASAEMKNGVLEVCFKLPEEHKSPSRQIEIKEGASSIKTK